MTNVNDTLKQRGSRYGAFNENAEVTMRLWDICNEYFASGSGHFTASHRLATFMIVNKLGRMLTGDPNYGDNPHDIAGYATLLEQELSSVKK